MTALKIKERGLAGFRPYRDAREFEQDSGIKPLMPLYFHSQGHEIKELFSCLNIWLEEPKK